MEKKIRQKIELNATGKAKLAKAFGVTVQNVSQALLFKRNSSQACQIREAALINGGSLVQIIDVTDELKRMRLCQNAGTTFFYAQSPDFHKPGLCYYPKFLYL